jgi:hypothetical protein
MNYRTPFVNQNGIAILDSTGVSVGAESVTFTLNEPLSRFVPSRGLVLVNLVSEVPAGTTETLPVRFTMNGFTSAVTTYGGADLTVADLAGTGMYLVYYDRVRNILQIMSGIV